MKIVLDETGASANICVTNYYEFVPAAAFLPLFFFLESFLTLDRTCMLAVLILQHNPFVFNYLRIAKFASHLFS
jgi:hypothetical protein